MTVNNYI